MTSNLSNTLYASRRKELLALINQLRAVGAQNDLDLPRITVIGNQSAGKSSVVEAISGITVPRDAGTCTRCPMECRLLSSTGPWTCRISIRNEFDSGGNRLREVSEIPFGETMKDKSQVELALRRAQFSVLNPGISQKAILNASSEELKNMATQKSMPFSKNIVCVDLEGPELTDLSFIDLPGLIQNAEPDVVQLVEDMVVSHIGGNSLILIALPMTDDIENQKALLLAKRVDKEGRRTIGVLTKPDMLGTGSTKAASLWLDVLEDHRYPLMHGYYCTRQPNDDERCAGIGADEARATEEKFFKTTTPWSKSTSPLRFGIKNLISSLSRLLVQIIDDSLPKIREDTSKQLSDCRRALEEIPPPISEEPATYLLSLVTTFCSEFQTLVRGRADSAELIRLHRQSYGTFKTAIRKTAPNFIPCVANEKVTDFNNCLPDEEDDAVANVSVAAKPSMNLTDVKKHVEQSITRELPNNVPYEAKASLIVRFQVTWPKTVDECFQRVEDVTLKLLLKMVEERFGRFALLQSHIRNFIKTLMDEHKKKCKEMLEAALEAERMPYTQNDHYLETTTQAWLNKYKAVRSGYADNEELDPNAKKHKAKESSPGNPSLSGASSTLFDANAFGAAASASIPPSSASGGTFGAFGGKSAALSASPFSNTQTGFGGKSAASPVSPFSNHQTGSFTLEPKSSFSNAQTGESVNAFGAAASASIPLSPASGGAFAAFGGKSAAPSASPFSNTQTGFGGKSAASPASPFSNHQTGSPTPGAKSAFSNAQTGPSTREVKSAAPPASLFSKPSAPQVYSEKPMPPNRESVSSKGAKGVSSIDEDTQKALQEAIGLLVQAGLPVSSLNPTELLGKLMPPDEYEKELKVMAEVRGYFQVTYKRMIDNIPCFIDLLFVRKLGDTLQPFLISKFGMGTPSANERCASYLGEDPVVVANREELLARKKRLESVDRELDEYSLHV
ncbi:hypothetical protein BT96DRAFT_1020873 [Gymnopus androsaceus JB14]|uniref:P-loop containing nucleoside triphosphate hydrolase protein n=1 Tax=Gymnopus androsaceus JB14 TaxID=1447944 RepID=A0A6A4HHA9_9AGAR|nr:hypothetical protein BT96DRAFT_1020873 [Gymnopus androsaceus JB14]